MELPEGPTLKRPQRVLSGLQAAGQQVTLPYLSDSHVSDIPPHSCSSGWKYSED